MDYDEGAEESLVSIGSYTLIKNERPWIGAHLASWLPHLDQMVFFDGNSTDGTLEIIKDFISHHPQGHKIKLAEDRDPENLQEDYVRLFNECMWSLDTDWAIFLHPDMIPVNPGAVKNIKGGISYFCRMESYAGKNGQLLRISGRAERWKNIYRLRNPELGAHYHGFYGAANEDTYFSDITGDEHKFFGEDFGKYSYEVKDSSLRIMHFSDVRTYERRLDRMVKCLVNQGMTQEQAEKVAPAHPRVTLKDGDGLSFIPAEYPEIFKTWWLHKEPITA